MTSIAVLGTGNVGATLARKWAAAGHHVLLGGGTIVIEGLDLSEVEPGTYEMFCLPLRVVGGPPRGIAAGRRAEATTERTFRRT